MRLAAILVLGAIALGLIASAGCFSKRASVPNPANGQARALSEVAR
ncbi:hypothetical protein [Methylobacterium variabile]|nr:hypothetical protein [Methylobacterium variabile]